MKNAIIAALVAAVALLVWAGTASADTYIPLQISSASINDHQQLTVTWVVPPSGRLSLMSARWKVWDASAGWIDYTHTGDFNYYTGGSYTWTLDAPMEPPADGWANMHLSVQVYGWDQSCTWDNHGILFNGCNNYSAWTNFALSSSCSTTLITAGHYIIKSRGHYLKRHGHYVVRHHRRVWIKPVRVWVAPVYGDPTCVWVNA